MTNEELLKVLDLPEYEQAVWCEAPEHGNRQTGESLADLAFWLRDEVTNAYSKDAWWDGICVVVSYVEDRIVCSKCKKEVAQRSFSWVEDAQPIHWIVAALIAKNENRSVT